MSVFAGHAGATNCLAPDPLTVTTTEGLVDAVTPGGVCTAASGDTITVVAGNYSPSAPLTITQSNLTIVGPQTGFPGAVIAGGNNTAGTRDIIDVAPTGSLTLRNVSLRGADSAATAGINDQAGSTLLIENSDVQGNNTTGVGVEDSATVTIRNSTVAFNSFGNVSGGVNVAGTLHVFNSTIVQNDYGLGFLGGTADVTNTIVANNTASGLGDCALGAPSSSVKSFDTDGSSGLDLGSHNPQLGTLASNGGSTLSFAPNP